MANALLLSPVLILSLVLAGGFFWVWREDAPVSSRRSAGFGMPALALLFLLGGIWPSPFTLAAILAAPAFLVLAWVLSRPRRLPRAARLYVAASVALSPLSYAVELVWLLLA